MNAETVAPLRGEALDRVARYFESLSQATLANLDQIYAADARFKDPFNDVQGLDAIARIYEHMFVQVDDPRFVINATIEQGCEAMLLWDFLFGFRRNGAGERQRVRGSTHLRFGPDGRIVWHRDYWDVAEELYEKLPVLGVLMRWLKRRASR
jgi:ketosteroid isomerase-like protein